MSMNILWFGNDAMGRDVRIKAKKDDCDGKAKPAGTARQENETPERKLRPRLQGV